MTFWQVLSGFFLQSVRWKSTRKIFKTDLSGATVKTPWWKSIWLGSLKHMVCHRKAMGLAGKSIAFLPHFSRFFGEKTAIFRRKRYAWIFNALSLSSLQNFARFQNLEATRQLVNKIARKWHLQKSKCKRIPWFSLQSVITPIKICLGFNKNRNNPHASMKVLTALLRYKAEIFTRK